MVNRRTFLVGNITAAVASSSVGLCWPTFTSTSSAMQQGYESTVSQRDFWNDWPDYMIRNMNAAGASRKALLANIRSKHDVEARSAKVRGQLWELLGGHPMETPLNARETGRIERSGYRIEKIVFESMPEVYVTANLYLPTIGKQPYPGIIVSQGHTPNGKEYRDYQYAYQSLAKKGYAVLAYDPFGQGERIQYPVRGTNRSRYAATGEHSQAGRPMILFGSGFARYRVWDGMRALDYLMSRPEVDPRRIGCAGHSGGATMTMYMMALDPRIQTAVSIEGNFENVAGPSYDPPGAIADAEQNIVGSLPLGLDRGDLMTAFAPKPFLLCYTAHDEGQTYSPVYRQAIKENYDELVRVYGIAGAKEKVGIFEGNLPHELDFFARRAMYGWFNRWLGKSEAGVEEEEFDASPESALDVTTTGQVLTSLGGKSVVQLNRERAKELLPTSLFSHQGVDVSSAREQVRTQLRTLLALPSGRTPLNQRILSSNVGSKLRMEEVQYESEPGIRIAGWHIRSKEGGQTRPAILFISDALVNEPVAEPNPMEGIFDQGTAVLSINLRGMGLSSPRPPHGGPVFYRGMPVDERFAWANMVLGKPVIGQRVWDILRAVDYLKSRQDVDASQIRIVGEGSLGLAALMAAALDGEVRSILLNRTPVTYSSVVDSEDYALQLDWFVPGILKHFDVQDITAAISPRPVWIINALDVGGSVLTESAVQDAYSQRIPASSSALKNLRIRNTTKHNSEIYLDWLKNS